MSYLGNALAGRPTHPSLRVQDSPDFWRIDSLPRTPEFSPEFLSDLVAEYTEAYRNIGGTMTLRPIQALALRTLRLQSRYRQGALLPMGVGSGKTLVSLLAGSVYFAQHPVLFTYASLVNKTLGDIAELSRHWQLPRKLRVLTWESLSSPDWTPESLSADLVIADECHAVKSPLAARTKRFLRFFLAHPTTPLVALSGTLTTRSLADFAHLSELALGAGSPLPLDSYQLKMWGLAIDEEVPPGGRIGPGVLSRWLESPSDTPRAAFRRRLVSAPGVVATADSALGTALNIHTVRSLKVPAITGLLKNLNTTGCDPDGTELEGPADFARVAKCLGLGYWLRWQWPGQGGRADWQPWLSARNAWNRAVRTWLGSDPPPPAGLDSPGLVRRACDTGAGAPTPELAVAWEKWALHVNTPPPPVVPQFSKGALRGLCKFVASWGPGIVWVPGPDIGEALARETGIPYYPAGRDPSRADAPTILCSSASHGVGKNLQHYSRNLVLVPPASGNAWEQLLGRTHRPGQAADSVECTVLLHHGALRVAWDSALRQAEYIQQTTGNAQKLCQATIIEGEQS